MSFNENYSESKRRDCESKGFACKLTQSLGLPDEVVLNMPRLTISGNRGLLFENYTGIIEFEAGKIRVNTKIGTVKIIGNNLSIKEITSEDIIIGGNIHIIDFNAHNGKGGTTDCL